MTADRPAVALGGGGRVDLIRGEVVRGGEVVAELTSRDLALLQYFVDRPLQDLSRDELATTVLGQAPGVLSRALDSAVFRLRSRIELDPTRPSQIVTVQGFGYRFVPIEEPKPTSNVPPEREPLIGRDPDQVPLSPGGFTTLVGAPGIGKTTLALAVARRADNALLVDLSACASSSQALQAVAAALEVPAEADVETAIGWALAHRGDLVLVLDDADRVAAELGPLLEGSGGANGVTTPPGETGPSLGAPGAEPARRMGWIERASEVRVLVTSRVVLGGARERVVPLDPLPTGSGRELFLARARAVRSTWEPDGTELATIDRLVDALDGIPLAIELAASRVGALPPAKLLERLSERLRLLSRPGRDRQATLRAAIEQSWSALSEEDRGRFARLSVFADAFEPEVAERVAGVERPALDRLVRRSLVARRDDGRYRVLASLRAFADEQLDEADRAATWARHADWFCRDAEDQPTLVIGPRGLDVARRVRAETVELEAVVLRYGDADPVRVGRALICLRPGQLRAALDPELDARLIALRLGPEAPQRLRFVLCRCVGYTLRRHGRYPETRAALEEAAALAASEEEALRAEMDLAALDIVVGRPAEAVTRAEAALKEAERLGLVDHQGVILADLGVALKQADRLEEARQCYERALALLDQTGAVVMRALVVGNLGILDAEQGRVDQARQRFEEAARAQRELGNTRSAGVVLLNLGQLLDELGEVDAAEANIRESLDIMLRTGSRRVEGLIRSNLGGLCARTGRLEDAHRELDLAQAIATELGHGRDLAVVRAEQGLLAWVEGRRDDAVDLLRASVAGSPGARNEGLYRAFLGGLLAGLGRAEEGRAEVAAARAIAARVGDPVLPLVCDWMERLGDGGEPPALPERAGWQLRFAAARWVGSASRTDMLPPLEGG